MWTPKQKKLFDRAHRLKNTGHYENSLAVAEELLGKIGNNPLLTAYVTGCIKAVNLRLLGRAEEAEDSFDSAYRIAVKVKERGRAIAAYILSDWASMKTGREAREKVQEAIDLLRTAKSTPDPERDLMADLAYFRAARANIDDRYGPAATMEEMATARRLLRAYMKDWPRYKAAYFNVLIWELKLNTRHRSPRVAGSFVRVALSISRQERWHFLHRLSSNR